MKISSATASPNIALIKYWGKKDSNENIPTNRSVSLTLTKLITRTEISPSDHDQLYINGEFRRISHRIQLVIDGMRQLAKTRGNTKGLDNGSTLFIKEDNTLLIKEGSNLLIKESSTLEVTKEENEREENLINIKTEEEAKGVTKGEIRGETKGENSNTVEEYSGTKDSMKSNYKGIRIDSKNNFPDSCGLASSASGVCALVKALNDYYDLKLTDKELSEWARYGSGSASRSIYQGFVCCEGLYSKKIDNWNLRVFVVIVNKERKKIGSTEGMIRTVKTSDLFKYRMTRINDKVEQAIKFIKNKDFENLAELTMKESNEIHAIFLDSYPPINYLTKDSFSVIELCHEINNKNNKVMYTFDAGPNAFILTQEKDFDEVLKIFKDHGFETIIAN